MVLNFSKKRKDHFLFSINSQKKLSQSENGRSNPFSSDSTNNAHHLIVHLLHDIPYNAPCKYGEYYST